MVYDSSGAHEIKGPKAPRAPTRNVVVISTSLGFTGFPSFCWFFLRFAIKRGISYQLFLGPPGVRSAPHAKFYILFYFHLFGPGASQWPVNSFRDDVSAGCFLLASRSFLLQKIGIRKFSTKKVSPLFSLISSFFHSFSLRFPIKTP